MNVVMEVILLEKVAGLGTVGDTVTVRCGYARNFLLPRGKVLRATASNKKIFEEKRLQFEAVSREQLESAQKLAAKLDQLAVIIPKQAGDDGRLFGSLTTSDVALAIFEVAHEKIECSAIVLPARIKEVGIYTGEIKLHPDVAVVFKIEVTRGRKSGV